MGVTLKVRHAGIEQRQSQSQQTEDRPAHRRSRKKTDRRAEEASEEGNLAMARKRPQLATKWHAKCMQMNRSGTGPGAIEVARRQHEWPEGNAANGLKSQERGPKVTKGPEAKEIGPKAAETATTPHNHKQKSGGEK